MRVLTIQTKFGDTVFWRREDVFDQDGFAVFFHGWARTTDHLEAFALNLPFGVLMARLPQFGGADIGSNSLAEWIAAYRRGISFLPRKPDLVIGESLGSLVALAQGYPCVAIEPFLSTAKLWPIHAAIAYQADKGEPIPLARELFADRDYRFVLDDLGNPTLVIAGDVPLDLQREMGTFTPSLLDDEDFAAFEANPHVRAVRVEGGHALIDTNPAICRALIIEHYESLRDARVA